MLVLQVEARIGPVDVEVNEASWEVGETQIRGDTRLEHLHTVVLVPGQDQIDLLLALQEPVFELEPERLPVSAPVHGQVAANAQLGRMEFAPVDEGGGNPEPIVRRERRLFADALPVGQQPPQRLRLDAEVVGGERLGGGVALERLREAGRVAGAPGPNRARASARSGGPDQEGDSDQECPRARRPASPARAPRATVTGR